MESFGTYLKEEREARKISLDEISRATKIRRAILEAIEKDQGEVLLPEVVVKGFIEAYARYVGLDPKEVLSKYSESQKDSEALKGGDPLLNGQRRIPRKYFFVGALCLILIIIIIPLLFFSERRPREGVKEAALARPHTAYENMVPSADLQSSVSPPSEEEPMPVQTPPVGVGEAQEVEAVEEVVALREEEPSSVHEHTLVIQASERTWIQVQEGSSLPLDVILYPGDSFTRKSSQQLAIVIGNAGGVTVTFDGTVLASLGEVGQVVRLTLPSPEGG
jgi:cytoskeleton protein RodZ